MEQETGQNLGQQLHLGKHKEAALEKAKTNRWEVHQGGQSFEKKETICNSQTRQDKKEDTSNCPKAGAVLV